MTLPSTLPQPPNKKRPLPPRKQSASSAKGSPPKHKKGGQPGNQNARIQGAFSVHQPGPLKGLISQARALQSSFINGTQSLPEIIDQAQKTFAQIVTAENEHMLPSIAITKVQTGMLSLSIRAKKLIYYARLRRQVLESLALDPFTFFWYDCEQRGITRDADSFFPVSKLSARNSPLTDSHVGAESSRPSAKPALSPPWGGVGGGSNAGDGLPPGHPSLATNLTDEQWAVLAPLIPPDPVMDWLTGEPPAIIAANRWGFTRYSHVGKFNDLAIMQKYNQVLQRFPALMTPARISTAKKRGRPRNEPTSHRALLDAIIWKLATGQTWDALPEGFPPMRICRKYYRRLFLSGRLYTLLLALYNHLRLEAGISIYILLKAGVFTTTPSQKITLKTNAPPIWQIYTALLFMQLAREAFSSTLREKKRANPSPHIFPFLMGSGELSTGKIPGLKPQEFIPAFEPLEKSSAYKKWKEQEKFNALIKEMLQHRFPLTQEPAP